MAGVGLVAVAGLVARVNVIVVAVVGTGHPDWNVAGFPDLVDRVGLYVGR